MSPTRHSLAVCTERDLNKRSPVLERRREYLGTDAGGSALHALSDPLL